MGGHVIFCVNLKFFFFKGDLGGDCFLFFKKKKNKIFFSIYIYIVGKKV